MENHYLNSSITGLNGPFTVVFCLWTIVSNHLLTLWKPETKPSYGLQKNWGITVDHLGDWRPGWTSDSPLWSKKPKGKSPYNWNENTPNIVLCLTNDHGIQWNIMEYNSDIIRMGSEWDFHVTSWVSQPFPVSNNSPSGSKWEWLGWVSWQMWLGVMAYWVRWFSPMPTKTSTSLVDFPLLRVITRG